MSASASFTPELYHRTTLTTEGRFRSMYGTVLLPLGTERILDWGCSTGETTKEIAQQYPRCTVIGMDMNLGCIVDTASKENIHFHVGDGYLPPFAPASFGAVFCNNNLGYILQDCPRESAAFLLAPAAELVREGGYMGLSVQAEKGCLSEYDTFLLQRTQKGFAERYVCRSSMPLSKKLHAMLRQALVED